MKHKVLFTNALQHQKLHGCKYPYLQSASLHHDLLSVWLNSCQGKELSFENHGWFLSVQLYGIKLLFAPFHINWNKR